MREVARLLGVNHQSVANWMAAYARYLPPDLPPDIAEAWPGWKGCSYCRTVAADNHHDFSQNHHAVSHQP